jgi:hypothetical protein
MHNQDWSIMPVLKVGSLVSLKNASAQEAEELGTVVNVIPSDTGMPDFTRYDVDFAFGIRTLHGSELSPVLNCFSLCDKKERLLTKHKKAFEIYMRGVLELAEAAGMMAHAEFEYLYNKVRNARQFLVQAREQLNEHSLKHGC